MNDKCARNVKKHIFPTTCRGSQSKAVRRVVHPKVYSSTSSVSEDDLNKNNNMDLEGGGGGGGGGGRVGNVESITAAVAASAAVAATQPFLKVCDDGDDDDDDDDDVHLYRSIAQSLHQSMLLQHAQCTR